MTGTQGHSHKAGLQKVCRWCMGLPHLFPVVDSEHRALWVSQGASRGLLNPTQYRLVGCAVAGGLPPLTIASKQTCAQELSVALV